jgi:hypothetical protein
MIEFTEEDRERVRTIAARGRHTFIGEDNVEFLRLLAERPAGDAGLRELLDEQIRIYRERAGMTEAGSVGRSAAAGGKRALEHLAALADSTEGGERS